MSPTTRPHLGRKMAAGLLALATIAVAAAGIGSVARADASDPAPVTVQSTDTGVVDLDRDGEAEYASYGERNAGLSAGEQGGDGWELRYLAPFAVPTATVRQVEAGGTATLEFRVWRADELDGRHLVVTALAGGRAGTADFTRGGIEVFRGAPRVGVLQVDVTDAVRRLGTSALTFRFAADRPPTAKDYRYGQINIATGDGRAVNRPTLRFTAAASPKPRPAAPAPPPAPAPAPRPEPEPTTTTTAPRPTTTTTAAPRPTTTTTAAPRPTTTTTVRPRPTPSTVVRNDTPRAPAPAGMTLAFADEFDGSALDTSVWEPYHSTYGDGNNELQCHTPGNVRVSDGTLKITARRGSVTCPNGSVREFSSGFLGTRENGRYFPRYGRFEMRARVPHAQGLWPAFWLRHRDGAGTAEVDIMEYFHSQIPGETTGTLHLDGRVNLSKDTAAFEAPTANPGWHTWAVDILPVSNGVSFTFSLDGRVYHSYTDTQRRWATSYSDANLWDIALNLSVGGDWVGDPDGRLGWLNDLSICAQWGSAGGSCTTSGIRRAAFPTTYEVDYVRVFKKA